MLDLAVFTAAYKTKSSSDWFTEIRSNHCSCILYNSYIPLFACSPVLLFFVRSSRIVSPPNIFPQITDFQGMNFIPPTTRSTEIFPSFVPAWVRVPGLKQQQQHQPIAQPAKRRRADDPSTDASHRDKVPTNLGAEVKVSLLAFAVAGQQSTGGGATTGNSSGDSDSDGQEEEGDTEEKGRELVLLLRKTRRNCSHADLSYLGKTTTPDFGVVGMVHRV